MAYKEETMEIIEEMKAKEKKRNISVGIKPENILVTKEWIAQRVTELYDLVYPPSYLNTVGHKLRHTIKQAKKLLEADTPELVMVRWDVSEYRSMIKTILDYAEVAKDGTIKVNRQEWLSAMNTLLIAYSAMHGLEKTTIEAHLQRESSESVDYNGRKDKRSSDEPRRVRRMQQGGLKPEN